MSALEKKILAFLTANAPVCGIAAVAQHCGVDYAEAQRAIHHLMGEGCVLRKGLSWYWPLSEDN